MQATTTPLPRVSVLVSTRDRRHLLDRLLDSLARLDYPQDRIEVVVVEETDDPNPPRGVRYLPIPRENKGFGYTRNQALDNADGELVAFTDDDCRASEGWLRELTAPFVDDHSVDGVAGAVHIEGDSLLGACEFILGFPGGGLRYIASSETEWTATRNLSTCNCAYRREAVLRAGGFSLDARYGGEDELLGRTVSEGGRCVFNSRAVVFHRAHRSLGEIYRWFARRGRSEVAAVGRASNRRRYLARVASSSMTLRLLAAAPLVVILFLASPPAAYAVALASALFYYSFQLFRYRYALGRCPVGAWLATPLVKMVMDFGQDWGRLSAFVKGLHRL